MQRPTVYFYASRKSQFPITSDFRIFHTEHAAVDAHEFTFSIIGFSHLAYSEALDYCECFSSTKLSRPGGILIDRDNHLVVDIQGNSVEIDVRFVALHEIGSTALSFPIKHVFPNGGTTGIKTASDSFSTIHTYPEYDCAIITTSRLSAANTNTGTKNPN